MALGTALTVASAASSAIGAGMSFAQASRNRKLQLEAEQAAEEAMKGAKRELEVNYYDQLSLPMQAYDFQRDANLAAGAQAIEAGRESERGGVGTVGKIQMAQQDAQQKLAGTMADELMGLEKLSAVEDARLAGERKNLQLAEVEGAQKAAASAQQMAAASMQGGFNALSQGLKTGIDYKNYQDGLLALYGKVSPDAGQPMASLSASPIAQIGSPNASSLQRTAPSVQGLMPAPASTGVQRQPIVTFGPQGNVSNYNPNAIPFDYNSSPPSVNPFDLNAILPYLSYLRR
jgi:hypothetical protein